MPSFFPEGNTAQPFDNELRSLIKLEEAAEVVAVLLSIQVQEVLKVFRRQWLEACTQIQHLVTCIES